MLELLNNLKLKDANIFIKKKLIEIVVASNKNEKESIAATIWKKEKEIPNPKREREKKEFQLKQSCNKKVRIR